MNKKTLLDIIHEALKNNLDPVAGVKDYLEEKDTHLTYPEAKRLVERLLNSEKGTHMTTLKALKDARDLLREVRDHPELKIAPGSGLGKSLKRSIGSLNAEISIAETTARFFPVIGITREELAAQGVDASDFSDDYMAYLAGKIAGNDAFMEQYWATLKVVCDEMLAQK